MQTLVTYEVREQSIAFLVLNDPQTRNALSDDLLDQLIAGLERARDDVAIRAVVLTSSDERVFSSGGNLKAFAGDQPAIEKYAGLDRFPRLYTLISELGKPVICAASGDVLAGAFGLALACDLILARDTVRLGCPEINVGLFPFMISALIFRSVPRALANELMLMGQTITAPEAARLGIINRAVPAEEFDETVLEWARRLASRSPLLMRMGKNAIDRTRDLALREALDALQAQLALAFTTQDVVEGVAAFREKREPQWTLR